MSPAEMNVLQGAWKGLKRVIASAKVQASVAGLTSSWAVLHFETAGLPPTQRVAAIIAFQGAVLVVLRELIAAWSAEDVATTQAAAPLPAPATQVNVGADSTNTQQTTSPTAGDVTPTPPAAPGAFDPDAFLRRKSQP